jgi:hypothetical protein
MRIAPVCTCPSAWFTEKNDDVTRPVGHHLRITAIADTGHVDPGGLLEQLEAEMAGRTLAGMAVIQRARL